MRIYVDGFLESAVEEYVGRAAFLLETARSLELLPLYSRPRTRDAIGIINALRLEGLSRSVLGGPRGSKFISIAFPPVRKWGLILRRVSTFCKPTHRETASGNNL